MTNDNELLQDFGDFIAARARKKVDAPKAAEVEKKEEVGEETNLFNASMGLKFKCGVCSEYHRSTSQSALKKIELCTRKLKRLSQEHVSGSAWSSDCKTIELKDTIYDHLENAVPQNTLFRYTHPKFLKTVERVSERISEQHVRHVTKTISVIEALGAKQPVEYLKAQVHEHDKHFKELNEKSAHEQLEFAGPVYEKLKNWLTLKPEKVKIEKNYHEVNFYKDTGPSVLRNIRIGTSYMGCDDIARSFETFDARACLFVSNPKEDTRSYVIDVDIWKDGYPAMLWTTRVLRGYNDRARHRSERHKKAKVLFGVVLFSTWDRKVWLVSGNATLTRVDAVQPGNLTELVMPKDERDYRNGAYFENL